MTHAGRAGRLCSLLCSVIAVVDGWALNHPVSAAEWSMFNGTVGQSGPNVEALQARRRQYLDWIIEHFGPAEDGMKPLDGRLWPLNHARLVLGKDLDRANRYFSAVRLTRDPDFMGIRLLKTLLDFQDSPRLHADAKRHLAGIIAGWNMTEYSRVARWPRIHTENHDIMCLTIGLFSRKLRGEPIEQHLNELRKSLAWRFQRGFYEWNSHRYQLHYTNPLQVLAAHAPAEDLRRAAEALFNVLMAERALLSVGGHLGGAFMRGYDRRRGCDYLDDNRYDSFLPTMWLAFGVAEPRFDYDNAAGLAPAGEGYGNGADPRLNQDEGMFFATGTLAPHPVISALMSEASTRPELVYRGKRATAGYPQVRTDPSDWRTNQLVCYYNTPHVSMGSVQHLDGAYPITSKAPSRYWSILFAADPAQVLRTKGSDDEPPKVVQYHNWLLTDGELSHSHGRPPKRIGPWNLYCVGRGLCAHVKLDRWHVFQVSDLDKHPTEQAFVDALSLPTQDGHHVRGLTTAGRRVAVDLGTMALEVDGKLRPPLIDMLHDCDAMRSRYGSGVVKIKTTKGSLTIDAGKILETPLPPCTASVYRPVTLSLPAGRRWGNPSVRGAATKVAHVRALGGISPDEQGMVLRSVSVFVPQTPSGSIRLAIYAGGRLERGPHAGEPARLLCDLGKTGIGGSGWLTIEATHDGFALPPATAIWIAWKGKGQRVTVQYQDRPYPSSDFQRERGRWESRAVSPDEETPWPSTWPDGDEGSFEDYWYSFCLSYDVRR